MSDPAEKETIDPSNVDRTLSSPAIAMSAIFHGGQQGPAYREELQLAHPPHDQSAGSGTATPDAARSGNPSPVGDEHADSFRAQGDILTTMSFRSRKRSKTGPEFSIVPTIETPMSRAVATASERFGEPVFFPYVGTTFASYEEAKEFYNLYSWEVGFGIRESRSKKNSNDYTTRKDIVCSCQGFCENKLASSARSGCKAMIRLHRTPSHGWIITQVVAEHNHPLSTTYGQKKQWGSHSFIDSVTKEFIRKLRTNNVALGRVCSIVGVSSKDSAVPIRKQAIRSLCGRLAQEDIKDDMKKTLELLRNMSNEDRNLQVRIKTDQHGTVEAMLWCTGKNQDDFSKFGDVVTFDTTYRTNLYDLPFGIFVGVNNHYQSIIFGGVLLNHERTEDFEWTFSNFKSIMNDKQPTTILIDQCQAMAAAIKSTLPGTRHRWCRWHILRNAKTKIGPSYSKKSTFKKKFNHLINVEISATAFEKRWHDLMKEYQLEGNKFLDRAFKIRGMWAKPYFMDVFCAGMTSTQRSESANHMLKTFIPRGAPMHVFVSKFRDLQFDRNQEEERQNYMTKQFSRRRRFGVPIEIHAEAIYTKEIYNRFSNELFEAGSYTIQSRSENGLHFVLIKINALTFEDANTFRVNLTGYDKVSCTCGYFEHTGLLCRHSLKVLTHLDRTEIPRDNITRRWTKQAASDTDAEAQTQTWEQVVEQTTEMKKRTIIMKALELSQSKITADDSALNEALRAINNIMPRNSGSRDNSEANTQCSAPDATIEAQISCPPRKKRNGRPRDASQSSWKRHGHLEKQYKRGGKENVQIIEDETATGSSKTRTLADLFDVTIRA